MAPGPDDIPEEFLCAATGKPLYLPVVTLGGVAYSYVALFDMFMRAQGAPICKVTQEPIHFLPSVCLPLHHHLLAQFKGAMRSRKNQDEAEMRDKYGLPVPNVTDAPDEEGEAGFLEEFRCAVSGELAYEPCALSSGSIVSAHCVPDGGFRKDPDRLIACALHGQAPRPSPTLEAMIKSHFPDEYADRRASLQADGLIGTGFARGTCRAFDAQAEDLHLGLGCDGCGLWPIRGKAWADADCGDRVGFHLCDDCYQFSFHKRVLTGKCSQGHLPRHRMVEIPKAPF